MAAEQGNEEEMNKVLQEITDLIDEIENTNQKDDTDLTLAVIIIVVLIVIVIIFVVFLVYRGRRQTQGEWNFTYCIPDISMTPARLLTVISIYLMILSFFDYSLFCLSVIFICLYFHWRRTAGMKV